jgi:hypothetical protein
VCKAQGDEDWTGCRICFPDVLRGGSIHEWTPGSWAGAWVVDKCYIDATCYNENVFMPQSQLALGLSAECNKCVPVDGDRSSLISWTPVPQPADPNDLAGRLTCTETWFTVPDPDNPGSEILSETPAYSGNLQHGTCWDGVCRGMAWTPWLPLGWSGAGVVDDVTVSGEGKKFVGSFGGGFGAGIPNPNPGECIGANCP